MSPASSVCLYPAQDDLPTSYAVSAAGSQGSINVGLVGPANMRSLPIPQRDPLTIGLVNAGVAAWDSELELRFPFHGITLGTIAIAQSLGCLSAEP